MGKVLALGETKVSRFAVLPLAPDKERVCDMQRPLQWPKAGPNERPKDRPKGRFPIGDLIRICPMADAGAEVRLRLFAESIVLLGWDASFAYPDEGIQWTVKMPMISRRSVEQEVSLPYGVWTILAYDGQPLMDGSPDRGYIVLALRPTKRR